MDDLKKLNYYIYLYITYDYIFYMWLDIKHVYMIMCCMYNTNNIFT